MNAADLETLFQKHFGKPPALLARAPGRVNILGEHTDYNDGPVLPAAINRAVTLAASPTEDRIVTLVAADLDRQIEFRLQDLPNKTSAAGKPLPGWARYPAGVAWSLQEAGLKVTGLQAVYTSDIPIGSGLSSSAAVEVGFGVLWESFGGWQLPPLELARLCQRAENAYVGVACGLMDQFASACGVDGHALFFDTRSLEYQAIPLPADISLVIADSGVRHTLADSAYNDRRAACEQAVEELRKFMPAIRALRDVSPTEFAAYAPYLPEIPRRRAEHIVKEIDRVFSMVRAMERGDRQVMGALMYAGHASMRDLFEASVPELDTLVELSRHLPGCVGARLTGAGFGGCTINLVETAQADAFIQGLKDGYAKTAGRTAQVYCCVPVAGASRLSQES